MSATPAQPSTPSQAGGPGPDAGAGVTVLVVDDTPVDRRKAGGMVDYCVARFTHVVADWFDQVEAGASSLGVMNGPGAITPERN